MKVKLSRFKTVWQHKIVEIDEKVIMAEDPTMTMQEVENYVADTAWDRESHTNTWNSGWEEEEDTLDYSDFETDFVEESPSDEA